MCKNKKCIAKINFGKLGIVNLLFLIFFAVTVFVVLISVTKYNEIESLSWTKCYPISYTSKIGICKEVIDYEDEFGLPEYSNPFPIQGIVTFQYLSSNGKNKTVNHIPVCGNSLEEAIRKGQIKYPFLKAILCVEVWSN